jgi:hypothetical protein
MSRLNIVEGTMKANRTYLLVAMLLVGGCTYQPEELPPTSDGPDATEAVDYDSEWNDRNADIYRYLLSQLDEPIPNRIYFITTTPKSPVGQALACRRDHGSPGDWISEAMRMTIGVKWQRNVHSAG